MPNDLSKIKIAQIQLNAAIKSLFDGAHLVVVLTLAGAASRILSDLVEAERPDEAWHNMACSANSLAPKEYFRILRSAPNELKHADRDRHAITRLDAQDVELALWIATCDLCTLESSTPACDAYQLWCFARYSEVFAPVGAREFEEIVETSRDLFGNLANVSREQALAAGRRQLQQKEKAP